jgi:hypothetical protein
MMTELASTRRNQFLKGTVQRKLRGVKYVDKKMGIENFPKLKRSDHSPKRDKFIDVSSDPPYF